MVKVIQMISFIFVGIILLIIILIKLDINPKLSIKIPIDFAKKSTVYETDFTVPFNIWGSDVGLFVAIDVKDHNNEQQQKTYQYISSAYEYDGDGYLKPPEKNPHFRLKITLVPSNWTNGKIPVYVNKQKKLYTKEQVIEEIVSLPLYGKTPTVVNWYSNKTIMIAHLKWVNTYHVKVESLDDVKIPEYVRTTFHVYMTDRLH